LQVESIPNPTTAVPPPPRPRVARPGLLNFGLFFAATAWYFCARAIAESASRGLAMRFDLSDAQPLVQAALLLFLVVVGFALLRVIEHRDAPLRDAIGLPKRATAGAEWATGAAIGWGLAVAAILPMVVTRGLSVHLWTAPRAFELAGFSLATLAIATLARDVGVFGYGFQRLVDAMGPVRATILMAVFAAIDHSLDAAGSSAVITIAVLTAVLVSLCWLRTHAVWLTWGLHFAWAAAAGVLFGLPLGGDTSFSSVVDARAAGPLWLTGGVYGPAAAGISILLALAAIPILVKVTSDWAWDYTRKPIVAAGYDVTIAPPAAHVAMEQAALAAAPAAAGALVQILPVTPQGRTVGGSSE